jgi:Fe-S-cluster containining protein
VSTTQRTLGQFVTDEKIVNWLESEIAQNHASSHRGAAVVGKRIKLPVVCATCDATKACCSSYVLVRLYEGLVVAAHLKRAGDDTPELRARLAAQADAMDATPVADWFKPCVFLDDAQRCSVYRVRPTTCAQLMVYTSPDLCNARSNEIKSYTPEAEVAAANQVEEAFRERLALRRKVGRRYFGTLPRMVLISLEAWDRTDFRDYLRQLHWRADEEWAELLAR